MKKLFLLLILFAVVAYNVYAQNTGIGTTSPSDQLHTTGSVRFQNYSGIGTRLLYSDSNGRLAISVPPGTVYTNNTSIPIPDNGCASNNGATSVIAVTNQASYITSSNINVRLTITHTNDADLTVFLIAPNGNILALLQGQGGANFSGTIFSDEAAASISYAGSSPYYGRYKPFGSTVSQCLLSSNVFSFGGIGGGSIVANGNWILKVFDNVSGATGTLNNWQITFDGQEAFGTGGITGPVPYFNNGTLSLSPISFLNGNIGVNNTSPLFPLDVSGAMRVAGNSFVTGQLNVSTGAVIIGPTQLITGTPGVGKFLTATNTAGSVDWQTLPAANTGFLSLVALTTSVPSGVSGITVPYVITGGPGLSGASFNDGNNFNSSSYTYTAPAAGVYHFEASVGLSASVVSSNTSLTLAVMKTGAVVLHKNIQYVPTGATIPQTMSISFQVKLAANEAVYMTFIQNSGVAQSISAVSGSSYFSGHRVY